MTIRLLPLVLIASLLVSDGDKEGRRGNELYAQQQYDLAIEAYEGGLAALSADAPRLLRYGLLNNLGAALLKSGDSEAAGEAFARALASAPEPPDVARTSYNAGNASFAAKDLESALAHYRESLLSDSDNEDAKYNYEFVKRQLEQQQEQQQGGQPNDQQDQEERDQEDAEGEQDQQGGEQEQEQESEQEQGQQGAENDQQPQDEQENQDAQSQQAEDEESGQEPQQSPTNLSQQEAERILQALQNEEEQLLRQVQRPKARPRQVEKDW